MFRAALAAAPVALLLAAFCAPNGAGSPAAGATGSAPAESLPEPWAKAVALHNRGYAALENEKPADAEAAYRELTGVMKDDPMPWANLAVALLRQQKTDEAMSAIGTAIEKCPAEGAGRLRGELFAIRGAILDWEGKSAEALAAYQQALEADPDAPETLYTLYRQAVSLGQDEVADRALAHLVEIRPENFVVLVEEGKRAIQEGDKTTATGAYLRIAELLWQAPPIAQKALDGVLDALKQGETPIAQAARVPAARLENVLKVTPMYRESLRALSAGIQAVPVRHFLTEPPAMALGNPLEISFSGERLAEGATSGGALALADFDGDGTTDTARIVAGQGDDHPATLEVRLSSTAEPLTVAPAPRATGLLAVDLYNDGGIDLLAYGPDGTAFWNGTLTDGTYSLAAPESSDGAGAAKPATIEGLGGATARTAAVLDYDIEGDLDLVLGGESGGGDDRGVGLYRNNLEGPLESVGAKVLPKLKGFATADAVAADVDRDGDTDLVLAGSAGDGSGGLRVLDNLRQGLFADRTEAAGLSGAPAAVAVVAADLDNDGLPELVTAGDGITVWANRQGPSGGFRFERTAIDGLPSSGTFSSLVALDLDNDGRLDLVAAGPGGVAAFGQGVTASGIGAFHALPITAGPATATAVDGADLDGDGDLDLVAAGPEGLSRLTNQGGDKNGWLAVRLRGLVQGNSKNNLRGVGASVEVKIGSTTQLREHDGRASHFGLGRHETADVVRVVWTNGVPQDRVEVAGNEAIVEEQVLKGSCPFLYAYTGPGRGSTDAAADPDGGIHFVTDLLWNAPAGLPVAPGVYLPADPDELVEVPGARSLPGHPGLYDLRITEELWEAAYFDQVRLWVVDHPADVEVASSLRIVPGPVSASERPPGDEILAARAVHPVVAATDGQGRDVTARVTARDDVYADGYVPGPYQGLAKQPWSFTFDLGPAAAARPGGGPVRLLLDGWIFPTDASLNLAIAQRDDLAPQPPRLEVETADGWQVLMPHMGHPAGKTKTIVVDTPPLPEGARRLRIVTNQWISWDRIAWSDAPADGAPRVVGRLLPARATLRYRGFSKVVRKAPNAPHAFDYARVSRTSPWEPTAGPYTRYGDVRELLSRVDDRPVVLGSGDEIALLFDASKLPPPPAGWERTLFLESNGWDKDFDRNTYAVDRGSLPLPFHGMGTYGPSMDEAGAPTPPDRGDFAARWLTREWPGPVDRRAGTEVPEGH